jgi:hypothetical protein
MLRSRPYRRSPGILPINNLKDGRTEQPQPHDSLQYRTRAAALSRVTFFNHILNVSAQTILDNPAQRRRAEIGKPKDDSLAPFPIHESLLYATRSYLMFPNVLERRLSAHFHPKYNSRNIQLEFPSACESHNIRYRPIMQKLRHQGGKLSFLPKW